jgi:hypothetical protein
MLTPKVGSGSTKFILMLLTAGLCMVLAPAVASAAKTKQITIRGTVSEYQTLVPGAKSKYLAGAKVWVAERPSLFTKANSAGVFTLKVPASAKITLVAEAVGYLRIYAPTRRADPKYRWRAFILPTLEVGRAVSALAGIPSNAANTAPKECLVSSLPADRIIRPMTPAQVDAHGPYGVSGVELRVSGPTVVKPLYLADSGLPDANLKSSTTAGIGLFIGLKAGTYKFTAVKAGSKFESFIATCKPGRFIEGITGQL